MLTFRESVLRVVRAIPRGRVATYGQVAALAGSPLAARQVGTVLRGSGSCEDIPWQRVVNASGGLSTYKIGVGELQRALLEAEGVRFSATLIDLRAYRWDPGKVSGTVGS